MAHECVECGRQTPPGALTCQHCGAEWPHRQRAVRAHALARRRRLVLLAVLGAVLAVVAVTALTGGDSVSRQCRDLDAATAKYDQAVAAPDPDEAEVAQLLANVQRLTPACKR